MLAHCQQNRHYLIQSDNTRVLSQFEIEIFISLFSYQWFIVLLTRVLLKVTVCYYHVTYVFQSKRTLYIYLNVKELLAQTGAKSEVSAKSNFMEIQPFKHSSNKFSLLCCRNLGSFNENVLRQRGFDEYFQERFLLVSTFWIFASVNFFLPVSKY